MFDIPNDPCNMIMTVIAVVIAVAFLVFKIQQNDLVAVLTFVLVLSILVGCCQLKLCRCLSDVRICILLAVLAANVVSLPKTMSHKASEAFTNPDDGNDTTDKPPSPEKEASKPENKESPKKEKESVKEDDNEDEPSYVDNFSTFMETYKSLTPGQIETMTTDTKDLIETQKTLMETVKSLAPVITQGKEMMDTFKDYFGPNSQQDLMKAFKPNDNKSKT